MVFVLYLQSILKEREALVIDLYLTMLLNNLFAKTITAILCLFCCTHAFSIDLPILNIHFNGTLNGNSYCYGRMSLNEGNSTVNLPAKFKSRGATASEFSMKPSMTIKLRDENDNEIDTTLLGIRCCSSWILDAMAIDRINMRNRVCMDVWNDMYKLPYNTDFNYRSGTCGKYVEVYINDTYKGIYCLSDRVNRKLLNLKKASVKDGEVTIKGVLYKHGTMDYPDQNTPGYFCDSTVYIPAWHDAWKLTEPDDYAGKKAWQPLVEYYNNNNWNYIETHFDYDNILHYTLFVMALGISDNWGNKNQYWSIRNITKSDWTFLITPWDLDTSLGGHYKGNYYDGNYEKEFTPKSMLNNATSPFSWFLKYGNMKEDLKDLWINYRETVFSIDSIAKRLYYYCDLLENSGAWQRQFSYWQSKKYTPLMVKDLRREVQLVAEWYQNKFQQLDDFFDIDPTHVSVESNERANKGNILIYNTNGEVVSPQYKGIYIYQGKKFLRK